MGKCCRCLPQESFWWDLATNCPAKFYPWASALQNLGPGNGIEKGGPMWGLMGIAWMTPTKTETVWEDMHDHRIFMNILHFTWTCFGMKRPLCDFPYYTVMHISWNGTFRQAASFFSSTAAFASRCSSLLRYYVFVLQRVATMTYTWIAPSTICSPRWDFVTIYHLHIHSIDLNMVGTVSHHSWVFPFPSTWVSDSTRFGSEIWNMSVRLAAVPHAMLSNPWVHVSQN